MTAKYNMHFCNNPLAGIAPDRPATLIEIRRYYSEQDCACRISKKGHVQFRKTYLQPWLDGRWTSEYRVDDQHRIYLS